MLGTITEDGYDGTVQATSETQWTIRQGRPRPEEAHQLSVSRGITIDQKDDRCAGLQCSPHAQETGSRRRHQLDSRDTAQPAHRAVDPPWTHRSSHADQPETTSGGKRGGRDVERTEMRRDENDR
jgi:hypothetical protein